MFFINNIITDVNNIISDIINYINDIEQLCHKRDGLLCNFWVYWFANTIIFEPAEKVSWQCIYSIFTPKWKSIGEI